MTGKTTCERTGLRYIIHNDMFWEKWCYRHSVCCYVDIKKAA